MAIIHPGMLVLCFPVDTPLGPPNKIKNFSSSLTKDDIGWVGSTELGSGINDWMAKYAPNTKSLRVERSAADCMKVLNGLTIEDSGAFLSHEGVQVPF